MNNKTKTLKNNNSPQSYMHASAILMLATALVKILGAFYKIPLGSEYILDVTGMGYFSTAYDLYVPMYSIAMAGLPIAISRIVAEHVANGRYKHVKRTLDIAKKAFIVTGGTGFVLMLVLAVLMTGHPFNVFNPGSFWGIVAIAPCLLFCCIMSAYRGYYEGLRNMTPTAVSQVIEAVGKLVFGLLFAYVIILTTKSYSLAAAGALFGITLGTVFSSGYLVVKYRREKDVFFTKEQLNSAPEPESGKVVLKSLLLVAVPIVLGSLVNNITSLIDVVMVQKQLANALQSDPLYFSTNYASFIASEVAKANANNLEYVWTVDLPNSLYGCHRGFAFSIYNLVPVLTSVLGVSAIPVLATAWTKRDRGEMQRSVGSIIRTTALIAIPVGCGIFAVSDGMLDILYSNESMIAVAAPNLRVLGICAIFAGLNSPIVNMLQAIGRQSVPIRNIAVGAVLKIVINFILVGTPEINIFGVPIGTTVCYAYICIANFICFVKYSGVMPNLYTCVGKFLISGIACGAAAWGTVFGLAHLGISRSLATVVAIGVAAVVYVIFLAILRALVKDDIISLPKGEKIAKVLAKFGIMR
ncbi:MAG: polysaccharide biosynthesis protein [Ruminococcaceae bacterium]|nr:polysaccharide biosynthesis protein [Oscillospiraceae bacterium]